MKTAIISLVFILLYLFLINMAFAMPDFSLSSTEQEQAGYDTNKVGFNEQVEVSVKSPRFYGTVYQADSKRELSLFNFIPIPLKKEATNYFYFHIPFLLLLATFNILQLKGGQE